MKHKLFILASLMLLIGVCWTGSSYAEFNQTEVGYYEFTITDQANVFYGWSMHVGWWFNAPLGGIANTKYWNIDPWSNCGTINDQNVVVTIYVKLSAPQNWSRDVDPFLALWLKLWDSGDQPISCTSLRCGAQWQINGLLDYSETYQDQFHNTYHNYYFWGSFTAMAGQYFCVCPLLNRNVDYTSIWQTYSNNWYGPTLITSTRSGPYHN
jgi:hypothetical protein